MKNLYKIPSKLFLTLCILASTLPFLNLRVLRMAGDEKVYVSQAIEMARGGRWFVQTLAGEPNYFKGPLHYILVRLGMIGFGNNLIAGLWMNSFFAIVTALILYALSRKRVGEENGILLGLIGGLNVGVFSHILASQMEVELCAFYALACWGLLYSNRKADTFLQKLKAELPFWIVAGAVGWVKSPAHSGLIGMSAVLYWIVTGKIIEKLRSPALWTAGILGILICLLGYLPVVLFDYENFRNFYILRENITKPDNNRSWSYVLEPLLHFSLPWTLIFFASFFKLKKLSGEKKSMALAGLSIALPTIFFFTTWPYKGQNYNLPAMCGLFVFALAVLEDKIPRIAYQVIGFIGLIAAVACIMFIFHFFPLPGWWKLGWPVASAVCFLVFSAIFLMASDSRIIGIGAVFFFLGFGFFITPLGEREMTDIRSFLEKNPQIVLHYDDVDPSIWSEWGLLQFTLHKEVFGVHNANQLKDSLQPGHAICLANEAALERTKKAFDEKFSTDQQSKARYEVTEWARWMTKGKNANGENMFKPAWTDRDLSKVERKFYILTVLSP